MRSLANCLSLILVSGLLLCAALLRTQPVDQFPAQPTDTPIWASFPGSAATPYVTQAIYQPFEYGFMVWRSDENCVYTIQNSIDGGPRFAVIPKTIPAGSNPMIYSYGYCLAVAPLIDKPLEVTPPAGLIEPTGVLGKVWRYYDELRTSLGYATQPEEDYAATIPTNAGAAVMDGLPFTMAQMTLPDGTILACGSRAATAGTC